MEHTKIEEMLRHARECGNTREVRRLKLIRNMNRDDYSPKRCQLPRLYRI